MEENNSENIEELQKKQEQKEAAQKTAHVAGKAAAQYLAPGAGGKIYDAISKTKTGQKIEKTAGNILQKMPGMNKKMNGLNKSGALDAADKGLDAMSGNPGVGKAGGSAPKTGMKNPTNGTSKNGVGTPSNKGLGSTNSGGNSNISKPTNAESSSESSQAGNATDSTSDSSSNLSGIAAIFQWFMKLPHTIKISILSVLGYVALILAAVILIVFIQSAGTALAEDLHDWMNDAGEQVENFFGNMDKFVTDIFDLEYERRAENAQKAYYQKLQEIHEKYKNELDVEIDVTLITATLFYEKAFGDYIGGTLPGDENDEDVTSFKQEYEFYKQAKNLIKTLAKYQIVETTTYNACANEKYPAQTETFPETSKEVASHWDNIFRFGFNARLIFNYVNPSNILHSKADGTTTNITWCPYSDAESQLNSYYTEDANYVETLKQEYESCKVTNQQEYDACQNKSEQDYTNCQQSTKEEYEQCQANLPTENEITACNKSCLHFGLNPITQTQYQNCLKRCEELSKKTCELKTCEKSICEMASCATEEKAYTDALARFNQAWGEIYKDGTFQCTSNNFLGPLSSYAGDEKRYTNHYFDLSAITTGGKPDTLGYGKIACSNYPSIEYSYSLDISREGVYYHKLLTKNTKFLQSKSFIERYYEEELQGFSGTEKENRMIELVEGIYDLYEYIAERSTYAYGNSNMCPNGVTVISGSNNSGHMLNPEAYPIGTFSLEDYVAMVVNGENNSNYDEAVKAQIIAARTYTLERTQGCTIPIRNSTEDQVAKANPDSRLKQLVLETSGQILTYNGETFLSQYDSFDGTCNGNMCTAVYTKIPNGETHTVSIPTEFVVKDSNNNPLGGHGQGMSQCAANYLASQGQTYEEILKYFYSDGVQISVGTVVNDNTNTGIALSTNGIIAALSASGYTLESYSNEMFTSVRNSGLGTASAVLTVADYATSKFYGITGGKKLNYTWGGGHSSSYAIYGFYSPYGLDCSSFISWVLYNAGFNYKDYVSENWGNAGTKYPLSSKRGKPGDLIWCKGHIALIIASDETGYYTAEAYSPSAGIINHHYAYNDTSKAFYTIDMTNFYQKNVNTNNYPMGG